MGSTFAFQLDVNHDELEAAIVVHNAQPGTFGNVEALREALREENVLSGIDHEAIEKAFAQLAEATETGQRFVIARGKPAKHGRPGRIDFKVDTTGKPTYHAADTEDNTSNIDFKKAMQIVAVKPGDVLAEITPPTSGTDGVNLVGKEIKAKPGKAVTLRAGDGVEVSADGLIFKATAEGRPVFSYGTLEVSPVWVTEGDVDFSTGDVPFNGHVVVAGNVQDDFTITSSSADIGGTVGASKIVCSGPVKISGGVNGHEKARIEVGGNADIKYVNQAEVIVRGDLVVRREIINSTIWCAGKVRAEAIVGGECLALGGIEASALGSELGINTVIEPGANFDVRKIDKTLATIAEQMEKILKPVRIFFGERAKYQGLPQEKRDEYAKAYEQFRKLKEAYIKLLEERQQKLADVDSQPVKQVIVRKLVYPDVFVRTDLCMKQFKNPLTGPLILVEDVDAGTIRAKNYTPGMDLQDEES